MPTKEWFEENPKVSAYISKELYNRLEEFMTDRGIKKVSQALTTILEETLESQNSPTLIQENTQIRLEALEGKVASLSDQLSQLTQALAISQLSGSSTVNQSSSIEELPILKALNQSESAKVSPKVEKSSLPKQTTTTSHKSVIEPMSERQFSILANVSRSKLQRHREETLEVTIHGKNYRATYDDKLKKWNAEIVK